jgi:ectoine hydroxylase-related dioxygenase (phytanoyl-CoA dioxygenase family)
VKPYSHRREWRHHFEVVDGVRKPVFDEDPAEVGMELLPLAAGQMVLFHDELLHGGVVNRGATCRVSIELTVLYDRDEARGRSAGSRRSVAAV